MSKLTLVQKVIGFLKFHANQRFTAREIATHICEQYADDFAQKRGRYPSDDVFINQITREVASQHPAITKQAPQVRHQDEPRPRVYWYADDAKTMPSSTPSQPKKPTKTISPKKPMVKCDDELEMSASTMSEHNLYPKLIELLSDKLDLYCLRIDEKTSKNSHGQNGNQWLHPDIVAMQAIDKTWQKSVQECVKISGANVRLWSFEVKKELTRANVRASFFQAVSNSSWANEGYLVANIINENVMEELRILSDLHGIGVILLDDVPTNSTIVLPAKRKTDIDWQSVNRIVSENKDFERYIQYVSVYYQTRVIIKENWNK